MKNFLKNASVNIGFLMILYTLLRIVFFVKNFEDYKNDSVFQIAGHFLTGVPIDFISLFTLNIFFLAFLLLTVFFQPHWLYKIFLKLLFFATNIWAIALNIIDLTLVDYALQRQNSSKLNYVDIYTNEGWKSATHDVNSTLLLAVGFAFLAFLIFLPRVNFKKPPQGYLKKSLPLVVLSFILIHFGSEQIRPVLLSQDKLALNSTYTFLLGDWDVLKPKKDFATWDSLLKTVNPKYKNYDSVDSPYSGDLRGSNVVLLIVESLNTEVMGSVGAFKGYTPFLDSLTKKTAFFKNHFSNARITPSAVPSLLYGVPALGSFFLTLSKSGQVDQWTSLAQYLKRYEYESFLFIGARKDALRFDIFANQSGFDHYVARKEFNDERYFDSIWGIWDKEFLQFSTETLSQRKTQKPFFATLITLSPHFPYLVPEDFKKQFSSIKDKRLQAVRYIDHSLEEFFKTASKQPWYKNTLFIITGDHTQPLLSKKWDNTTNLFHVPLFVFSPSQKLENIYPDKVTQHADVYPTVLDLLGYGDAPVWFGSTVFDRSNPDGFAVNRIRRDTYFVVEGSNMLLKNPDQSTLYKLKNFTEEKAPNSSDLKKRLGKKLKAQIQYFNNGIVEKRLFQYKNLRDRKTTKSKPKSINSFLMKNMQTRDKVKTPINNTEKAKVL